jgi:hypothetical protein
MIARDVSATVGDEASLQQLAPSAPYEPPARSRFRQLRDKDIIRGKRVKKRNPYEITLPEYPIPHDIELALEGGSNDVGEVISRLPDRCRPRPLEKANYVAFLQAQLWIEEFKAKFALVSPLIVV